MLSWRLVHWFGSQATNPDLNYHISFAYPIDESAARLMLLVQPSPLNNISSLDTLISLQTVDT